MQPKHELIQNKNRIKVGKCAEFRWFTSLRLSEKRQENLPLHLRFCRRELQFRATFWLRAALRERKPGDSGRVEYDEPRGFRFRTCAIVFASPADYETPPPFYIRLFSMPKAQAQAQAQLYWSWICAIANTYLEFSSFGVSLFENWTDGLHFLHLKINK